MITTLHAVAPADLLRISDLSTPQLKQLLRLSAQMKLQPNGHLSALAGETLACFFEKPSTRTRVSFAAAAAHLGMTPLLLRHDELQLGRGEPVSDTVRVLASYTAALVVRTFAQSTLETMAEWSSVPVINALSDSHHPCHALADLLTLQERFNDLHGLRLAYVGDGNNVAHSLMEAGALAGMHVVIATPAGYEPDPQIVAAARDRAAEHGGSINLVDDPRDAALGADAIYTDVWVSMGEEAQQAQRLRDLAPYQVNEALLALAQPHVVFMHCLPAHRGQEVSEAVIDGPHSIVWQQAANRMPTEQAVLYLLINKSIEHTPRLSSL